MIDVLSELWDRVFINQLLDVSIGARDDVPLGALITVTVVIIVTDVELTVFVAAVTALKFVVTLSYVVVEMVADAWAE